MHDLEFPDGCPWPEAWNRSSGEDDGRDKKGFSPALSRELSEGIRSYIYFISLHLTSLSISIPPYHPLSFICSGNITSSPSYHPLI
jgi:hypothetical protein